MSSSDLEKVIRLTSAAQASPPADEIRHLARDIQALLSEAFQSGSPQDAVGTIACAKVAAERLGELLYTDGLEMSVAEELRMSVLHADQPAQDKYSPGQAKAGLRGGVLGQILDGEATVYLAAPPAGSLPMHHAPFTGKHSHAHAVTMVHDHDHDHHGDSRHDGAVHGVNQKEKAAPSSASSRYDY